MGVIKQDERKYAMTTKYDGTRIIQKYVEGSIRQAFDVY